MRLERCFLSAELTAYFVFARKDPCWPKAGETTDFLEVRAEVKTLGLADFEVVDRDLADSCLYLTTTDNRGKE